MTPRVASTTTSLRAFRLPTNCTSSTWSAPGGLPFPLRPCLMFGLWSARRVPPVTRKCRPAYAVHWLLNPVQSLRPNLVPGWQASLPHPIPLPKAQGSLLPSPRCCPWWSHPGELGVPGGQLEPPARDCCLVSRRPAGSRPLVTGPCSCCPPFLPCGSAWVGWLRPLLAT